jgi:hypothetical protein
MPVHPFFIGKRVKGILYTILAAVPKYTALFLEF